MYTAHCTLPDTESSTLFDPFSRCSFSFFSFRFPSTSFSIFMLFSLTCSCCRQLRNLLHVPATPPQSSSPCLLSLFFPCCCCLPATEGCTLTGIKSTFYKLTTIFHKNIQHSFANRQQQQQQQRAQGPFVATPTTSSPPCGTGCISILHISQFCLAFLVISLKFS